MLELIDARERVQQTLTPPGGARDLLPAEYAYRLTEKALNKLAPGTYRFRRPHARHVGTQPRVRRSPAFEVR